MRNDYAIKIFKYDSSITLCRSTIEINLVSRIFRSLNKYNLEFTEETFELLFVGICCIYEEIDPTFLLK